MGVMVVQEVVQVMVAAEDLEGLGAQAGELGILGKQMRIPQVIQVIQVLLEREVRQVAAQGVLALSHSVLLEEEAQAHVIQELTGPQFNPIQIHPQLIAAQLVVIQEEARGEGVRILLLVLQAKLQILPEQAAAADQVVSIHSLKLAQVEEEVEGL
jgi:hypothetical protein